MQTITEEMLEEEEQSFVFNTEVRQTTGSFIESKMNSLQCSEIEMFETEDGAVRLSKNESSKVFNGRLSL